jgi:hypothetical protein
MRDHEIAGGVGERRIAARDTRFGVREGREHSRVALHLTRAPGDHAGHLPQHVVRDQVFLVQDVAGVRIRDEAPLLRLRCSRMAEVVGDERQRQARWSGHVVRAGPDHRFGCAERFQVRIRRRDGVALEVRAFADRSHRRIRLPTIHGASVPRRRLEPA